MTRFRNNLNRARILGILIYLSVWTLSPNALGREANIILEKMKNSYSAVEDYQADVLVRQYHDPGSPRERHFTYTFKRPEMIRLDFHSPHSGMVVVYPDHEGKVLVRPFPWAPLFTLHLDLDSFLISDPSGQRIDQTQMGLLIKNIERSLTIGRRGKPEFQEFENVVEIRVPAEDHFLRGVTTLYRFRIEKKIWLPVAVDERTPKGSLKRKVQFRDLKTNLGISRRFFTLEE